jgi:hypothetical protein
MAVQAVGEAQRILEEYLQPQPTNYEHILDKLVEVLERPDLLVAVAATKLSGSAQMTKQIPIALAACIATLSAIGMPTAQAKQLCSAAMPSDPHGRWWSYRLIDGRKCWYEGKPVLSKSLLEWPKQSAQLNSNGELASVLPDKPSSPLDSQAWAPTDSDSFEARWRARVEKHF